MITMKLRKPYTTASMWSSGKITCTGATSEDQAKVAARRFARSLQKLGFKVKIRSSINYTILILNLVLSFNHHHQLCMKIFLVRFKIL